MHVWGPGPFDNDVAEEYAIELDDADPDMRLVLLRRALQEALDVEGHVDAGRAFKALAAAAVVAASCPGAPRIESDYAPAFLALDDPPQLHPDLPPLARDALDRVEEPESGWFRLWLKADNLDEAISTLDFIRDALC